VLLPCRKVPQRNKTDRGAGTWAAPGLVSGRENSAIEAATRIQELIREGNVPPSTDTRQELHTGLLRRSHRGAVLPRSSVRCGQLPPAEFSTAKRSPAFRVVSPPPACTAGRPGGHDDEISRRRAPFQWQNLRASCIAWTGEGLPPRWLRQQQSGVKLLAVCPSTRTFPSRISS